jgi:hypothetical protein
MAGTGTSEKAHARKPRLRIFFTGCHTVFRDPFDNRIIHLLSKKYDIIVDEDNPDLLISSIFGNGWRHYRCKKMYYTGENSFPFMKYFSFSVTYGRTTSKNIRWPLYLMYDEYHRDYREMLLSVSTKATRKDYENRGFCSFVVSNPHGVLRNLFFERLSKRKKVDSGGRYKNNIGGHLEDKKIILIQL